MTALDYSAAEYVGGQIQTAATSPGRVRHTCDVVVVGTGPGGLTAACVLAEAGASVAMIEAGSFWSKGSFERSQSWALEHLVQDHGTRVMMGNTHVPVMSGRGVGGGTLINSGISFRAPDRVLDEWTEDDGVDLWGARDWLFAEVERTIGVSRTSPAIAGKNAEIARRGFARMEGVEHDYMPRNTPGCVGCGACQTGCPAGGKASADLNWLPRALRAGARVWADTEVATVLMRNGRAVGVRGTTTDPETGESVADVEIRADRVLLAAGAINTPLLLLRQKLANSSGQVGRNLHVQPGSGIIAEFDEVVDPWNGATQGYFAYHPDEPEVLAETFSSTPETFFAAVGQPGQQAHHTLRQMRHFAGAGCVVRDQSAGVIRPFGVGPPHIAYDVVPGDRRKLNLGTEFVAEMFFEAGARAVYPLLGGSRWFEEVNACRHFIRSIDDPADFVLYASHPMGSCRIGDDSERSVARAEDGRTHDHEGLYIMDASLMPTAIGVNPQMTIMAQSLALARRIAAQG